ncbi:uncharacterized protein LOC132748370 [Ruditapes philippinarum]|uniref:uncharacterized protein LOC132748370 n=1 Tax=Ruditapes philippinarum TaxID=129788 RepID=UPI00295B501A|nr:uncharacterized protein LOC132748370 [Ruditapes philippinarum]
MMDLMGIENLNKFSAGGGKVPSVVDTKHEKAFSDIPACTDKTFSLTRRHSTGTFITEAELKCCKDEKHEGQNYNTIMQVRKVSRQFSRENFIQDVEAAKCSRFYSRRNALCDPFRLLIPQHMREQLGLGTYEESVKD